MVAGHGFHDHRDRRSESKRQRSRRVAGPLRPPQRATFWLRLPFHPAMLSAIRRLPHVCSRIEKSIELNAPIERVWRALTDHNEFGEWFRVKLDGPFAPGEVATGRITYPGFEHVRWEARIKQMEAPRLFSFTWHPYAVDSDVDYSQEAPTLVEFRLEPTLNGTRLIIVESGFDAPPNNRKPDVLRMNDAGWTEQIKNIQAHVER